MALGELKVIKITAMMKMKKKGKGGFVVTAQ
jgi:hypothetical protein